MAPIQLVPRSERNSLTEPRIEINLLRAFMNAEDYISSITSMCMALIVKHVNWTAHRLDKACPPRVRLDTTDQVQKTSTPTYVKGAA